MRPGYKRTADSLQAQWAKAVKFGEGYPISPGEKEKLRIVLDFERDYGERRGNGRRRTPLQTD